jgi:Malectin domain/Bacterial TSP3 repeat
MSLYDSMGISCGPYLWSLKEGVAMLAQQRRIVLCAMLAVVLMAVHVHAAQVSLSWNAPTTNQDGTSLNDLAGYKVYYGFAPQSYDVTTDVGLTTSAVISGLEDGRTYYFAVTAYDTSGNQSVFSVEAPHSILLTDTDADGLTDAEELSVYGTDPTKADTDGDGINDGTEVAIWGANWNADADGDGLINLLDADSDNDGLSDGIERSQGTDPADPGPGPGADPVLLAVNAGGGSYIAGDGTRWSADQIYTPGSWGYVGGKTSSTKDAIANTEDDPLYRSERYGTFSYKFDVPNGTYDVTLYFAEIYHKSSGRRLFDVYIEGILEVDNCDLYAITGHDVAGSLTIPDVLVDDGQLKIDFVTVKDNAKVSAIFISSSAP